MLSTAILYMIFNTNEWSGLNKKIEEEIEEID